MNARLPPVDRAVPIPSALSRPAGPEESLPVALLRDGWLTGDQMVQALSLQSRRAGRLTDILLSRNLVPRDQLFRMLARQWSTELIPSEALEADVRLVDRFGPTACLRHRLLPLHQRGGITVIATARPEAFAKIRPELERQFGAVAMVIAMPDAIEAEVLRLRGAGLARAAEQRVNQAESCRDLTASRLRHPIVLAGFFILIMGLVSPMLVLWLATGWALLTLLFSLGLKTAAAFAALLPPPSEPAAPTVARLPVVSIMVALYREANIAPRLIRRLGRLDYPEELLDIMLVVEADDHLTRSALAQTPLPPWMRVVVVPDAPLKTKPRALNFALDHCQGTIIGVYDAEDAPEPEQIRKVVDRFCRVGPEVACLQGVLDFYNPATNWLSRCFTIEYAGWFRVILPGLQRLGLPIPLGGTTLFFRRSVLEELGGWDAHNVTEDADLGMRLCRHGYRTELITTVTHEEANCRALAWVKQRSRWLKGYMMTWATHMRDPRLLWRQLGARRFAGFQILFLGSLSQVLLAPLLWSFWLSQLMLPHPILDSLPASGAKLVIATFLLAEAVNIAIGCLGLHRSGQALSRLWVPSLHLYYPLASLAAYKALWELIRRPFYWDKTSHGTFDPEEP